MYRTDPQAIVLIWMTAFICQMPLPAKYDVAVLRTLGAEFEPRLQAKIKDSLRRCQEAVGESPDELKKVMAAILQEAADVANGSAEL
jgi:hypothetical protein